MDKILLEANQKLSERLIANNEFPPAHAVGIGYLTNTQTLGINIFVEEVTNEVKNFLVTLKAQFSVPIGVIQSPIAVIIKNLPPVRTDLKAVTYCFQKNNKNCNDNVCGKKFSKSDSSSKGGIMISEGNNNGTLGYFVKRLDPNDPTKYILSNNHVICNLNSTDSLDITKSGVSNIAVYPNPPNSNPQSMIKITSGTGVQNEVDAAIALLVNNVSSTTQPQPANNFSLDVIKIGKIDGTVEAALCMPISKHGAASCLTNGFVTHVAYAARVKYDNGTFAFKNQIRIDSKTQGIPFVVSGDSGSLAVSVSKKAVGLLFAGSNGGKVEPKKKQKLAVCDISIDYQNYALANPIQTVLNKLNVSF